MACPHETMFATVAEHVGHDAMHAAWSFLFVSVSPPSHGNDLP